MIPTGWSSTSSVLSAIVATQAVRLMDTPTAGLGPRGPPSDSGAAGATVTPRSPLPGGNASIREVLGRLARHSVRPGACAKRAARWLGMRWPITLREWQGTRMPVYLQSGATGTDRSKCATGPYCAFSINGGNGNAEDTGQ